MSRRWPLGSEVKRKDLTGGAMLYDASRAGNVTAAWFDASYWRERGDIEGEARGRGVTHFIRNEGKHFVLRHYRRGGLVARVMHDRYLWRGETGTRAFREWQLLYHLHRAGLPVPAPIAARYRRRGPLYTADLITERLLDSESLASLLRRRGIPILGWITIGRCIRMFHDLGVCHADLNAHNILLVGDDQVCLLDFDRGRLRRPGMWCDGNLVRLRRSLEKITYGLPPEHFSEADWHGLLDGYRQSRGHPGASGPTPAGVTPVAAATNGHAPGGGPSSANTSSAGESSAGDHASATPARASVSAATNGKPSARVRGRPTTQPLALELPAEPVNPKPTSSPAAASAPVAIDDVPPAKTASAQ